MASSARWQGVQLKKIRPGAANASPALFVAPVQTAAVNASSVELNTPMSKIAQKLAAAEIEELKAARVAVETADNVSDEAQEFAALNAAWDHARESVHAQFMAQRGLQYADVPQFPDRRPTAGHADPAKDDFAGRRG